MAEPDQPVRIAVLIAEFLSAFEITEIRGKLSGRTLQWDWQSYPRTMRKLRSTGLRLDWVRLHYLPQMSRERSSDYGPRAGLGDQQFTRLVIPIQTGDRITFDDRRLPTGALCYVDNRQPVTIANGDRLMAIHLMLDVYGSEQLRDLVRAAGQITGNGAAATG